MSLSVHLDAAGAWAEVSGSVRAAVGASAFDVWFGEIRPISWDGALLVLEGNGDTDRFITERFGRTLDRCASQSLGSGTQIAFSGDPAVAARSALTASGLDHTDRILRDQQFVPRYTFSQFIIGDGNHLAHAAALAVAEAPGQTYNPLFLHAPPGLGKTHLLHAIGNYIGAHDPMTTVRYTTVEAFTNDFVAALRGSALERFKQLYRDVDVLLIDDVQFLASKAKTEEEFFHTFNALYDSGRQLVLTCDRLPAQLTGIEQRLRARFEAGLVAHLAPPDRATRVAILRKRAAVDEIELPDDRVLAVIADRITDNVRSLEGAMIRVVANHSLTGRPLDIALATEILDEIQPLSGSSQHAQPLSIARIQQTVANHFAISPADLISTSRTAKIAWARQLAIYLTRELTDAPLVEIGDAFGGRNHTTMLHACKRVGDRVVINSAAADDLRSLTAALTPNNNDRAC